MKKIQFFCLTALFFCTLCSPNFAKAQSGRAIYRLSRFAIREFFSDNRSRYQAEICVHNDYRYTQYVAITFDGYSWYSYAVYPNKALVFTAGAIGIYYNNRYYTLASGGHHYLSYL